VGKRLGLPTQGYIALSDAKALDAQAGLETGMGAVLAGLSGINSVSGPGMLDFESCQSLEKLVLDNEVCGMALRLVRGVSHASAADAVELLRQLVETGSLLGHRHTRANFRSELLVPGAVIDRASYGDWEKAGSKDSRAAAVEQVQRILARGNPAPMADDLGRTLDRLIRAEGKRLGIETLPVV